MHDFVLPKYCNLARAIPLDDRIRSKSFTSNRLQQVHQLTMQQHSIDGWGEITSLFPSTSEIRPIAFDDERPSQHAHQEGSVHGSYCTNNASSSNNNDPLAISSHHRDIVNPVHSTNINPKCFVLQSGSAHPGNPNHCHQSFLLQNGMFCMHYV